MSAPDFLSIDETAARIGCHRDTVIRLVREGRLAGCDIGTTSRPHYRIAVAALIAFAGLQPKSDDLDILQQAGPRQ